MTQRPIPYTPIFPSLFFACGPAESTGLATGMLITALHQAGLVCLTHTPSPMAFLNEILGRPRSERPFLLLVTGYPAEGVQVPDIRRKSLDEFVTFIGSDPGP